MITIMTRMAMMLMIMKIMMMTMTMTMIMMMMMTIILIIITSTIAIIGIIIIIIVIIIIMTIIMITIAIVIGLAQSVEFAIVFEHALAVVAIDSSCRCHQAASSLQVCATQLLLVEYTDDLFDYFSKLFFDDFLMIC